MKSRTVFALLAGAAVGTVLGILLAPDKGEETRKKVKKTTEDCIDKGKERLSNIKKENDENVEESEE
jgi:gas vesicle protein